MEPKHKRFIGGVEMPPHFFAKDIDRRDTPVKVRLCEHPECGQRGEYRAPKSRQNIEDYYWFCLDHVREYNAAWDYYKGMNTSEIEHAIRFGSVWERPSWPFGHMVKGFKKRARAFSENFMKDEDAANEEAARVHAAAEPNSDPRFKAELGALRELGLLPPVDFAAIKKRYRALVKRHHPDVNGVGGEGAEDSGAQEKIKRLNAAFTLLKQFFGAGEKS